MSAVSGLDFPDDGRCVAVADWDQDGDLDLWLANRNAPRLRFMRNNAPTSNHYVSLRLIGNGTTTNPNRRHGPSRPPPRTGHRPENLDLKRPIRLRIVPARYSGSNNSAHVR